MFNKCYELSYFEFITDKYEIRASIYFEMK